MDFDRFSLHHGPMEVGVVFLVEADFPGQWGHIALDPALQDPTTSEAIRMARFIALSRESLRFLDHYDGGETSPEEEAVDAELAEVGQPLVDSDEWALVNVLGHRLPILCPIFRDDDEVVWRWSPEVLPEPEEA